MTTDLARNSILGALAGSSITLGSFLSGVIVARTLGTHGSGVVAYVVWLVLMIVPVVDLGTSSAVVRYVSEMRGRGLFEEAQRVSGHLLRVLTASVVAVSSAMLVVSAVFLFDTSAPRLAIGEALDGARLKSLSPLIVVFAAAQVFGAFNYAYLRGIQNFGALARLSFGSFVLQIACVTGGSFLLGIVGAVAGYAAGQLLSAAATYKLWRHTGPVDRSVRERVRRYSLYAWAANVANALVWSRSEIFFLERSWGHEAVAMFTVALALTALATQGPMLLTTGVLSFLAEKHGRNDKDFLKGALATGTRLLAALAFPACFGMAAIMPALLPVIYGAEFAPAIPAATILACAAAIGVTSVVGSNLVQVVERNDFIFLSSIFGAVLAVAAGFLLVPSFGVIGAAVCRVLIQMAMVAAGLWFVVKCLGYPVPFGSLGRLALAALVPATLAAAIVLYLRPPASIPIAIAAAVIAYPVSLRLTRALPAPDLALLIALAGKLPSPLRVVTIRTLSFVRG